MSDVFVPRRLEVLSPPCSRCPPEAKAKAIAWIKMPLGLAVFLPADTYALARAAGASTVTTCVCRSCGLEIQKEAAAVEAHVDIEEIR